MGCGIDVGLIDSFAPAGLSAVLPPLGPEPLNRTQICEHRSPSNRSEVY